MERDGMSARDETMPETGASGCPVTRQGGCPVIHEDFSHSRPLGGHWDLADQLRESSPVIFNSFAQGYWIFTRYEDVKEIYRNTELFSNESIAPWDPDPSYRWIPSLLDPPEQQKYRRILNPWFGPKEMQDAEPAIRDVCKRLVAETAPLGHCDFMNSFAMRFPTEAYLNAIGVDLVHAEPIAAWLEEFWHGYGGADEEAKAPMDSALAKIRDFWIQLLAEHRADPTANPDGIVAYLVNARLDGERPLTDVELLDILSILMLAGIDTTRSALGYLFHNLAMHAEHRRRLIAEPDLIPAAVEEDLRIHTQIFGGGRKVTRDAEFRGVQLHKGEMIYNLVAAANRDPRAFDRADEYVIDRKQNNHFGFASGAHRCLGLHLARRELQIAVEEWLRLIPDFELDATTQITERGSGITEPHQLPLKWDPKP
jgi:cytochrome P450